MLPFAVCTEFLDLCTVTTESMQCALTEDGSMFRLKFGTLTYERFYMFCVLCRHASTGVVTLDTSTALLYREKRLDNRKSEQIDAGRS